MDEQEGPNRILKLLFTISAIFISKRKSRPFINISLLCYYTRIFCINWPRFSYLAKWSFTVH